MKSSIGDFLAILRKSKGLTQQEVADRLGVSNKTVSSWETGASCPDISMLPAIAELFEVTCDELLRGERISSSEPQPRTEEKREKALGRMLAMYRNNAAVTNWICGALYAVAIIATLLIGCAALESLIGFFVGLIFIVGAVFLCILQNRNLRFQLTQNDFASDAIDKLMHSLSKKQTATLILASATFGFIFPHAFVPAQTGLIHAGLALDAALLYGMLFAAIATLIALLVTKIVHVAQKSYHATPKKFSWTLKNGVIPYTCLTIACAVVILGVGAYFASIPQPVVSSQFWNWASYDDMLAVFEESTLFSEYENMLHETDAVATTLDEAELGQPIIEETRIAETSSGRASYFFADFPEEFRNSYHTVDADGGTYVEVDVLTFTLVSGDVVSTPLLNPDFQGGLLSLNCDESHSIVNETEGAQTTYAIEMQFYPPLYETVFLDSYNLTIGTYFLVSGIGAVAVLGIYTAIYLPRRKKFLAKLRQEARSEQTAQEE